MASRFAGDGEGSGEQESGTHVGQCGEELPDIAERIDLNEARRPRLVLMHAVVPAACGSLRDVANPGEDA